MLLLQIGILGPDFIEHLMKKTVGHLHDIVLGKAGNFFAAIGPCIFKRVAHDLLTARPGDQFETLGDIIGAPVLDAGVGVLLVFAHNHHIHLGMLGPDIGIITQAGADIGIEPESLAGGDVERLETPALRCGDGGLEKNPGAPQGIPRRRLNPGRIAAQIDLLSDFDLLDVEPGPASRQDCKGGFHNFRANAIAAGNRDRNILCHKSEMVAPQHSRVNGKTHSPSTLEPGSG